MYNLTSPSYMPFSFFSCLMNLAKTFSIVLNKSTERGQPCVIPDLRRTAFSFSPIGAMLAISFSPIAFIIEVHSSYTSFVQSFYYELMLNFTECSFCIYQDDQDFIHYLDVVYHVN